LFISVRKPFFHTRRFAGRAAAVALSLLLLAFASAQDAGAQGRGNLEKLERAAGLIGGNRMEEAEQQLNEILRAAPEEAAALNLLGAVRAKQGRLDEAEALFLRSVRSDGNFIGSHMNLAYLYLLKGAPDKTILELKEVLRLDPDNADAGPKLARLLFSQGRLDECIDFIEKTKQSRASAVQPSLLVVLGDAYLRKSELARAEESYQLASERGASADALLGLALVAQAKGDSKNSAAYLSRARDLITDSPPHLYSFARVALAAGMSADAMLALKRAIELKPDEPRYHFMYGLAWLKKPDLIEAEQAFRRFLKYQPDNSQGQLYLGYVLLKQKKSAEARQWLEKSIGKEGGTPETFYYLGLIAQEEGEDERAVELLEGAVRLAPALASAHIALGSTFLKLKNYKRAQEELEAGVKLKPDDSKAHYNLAMLYARLKDTERAQAEMRTIERLKGANKSGAEESEILAPSSANLQ
jgi:tetratricopeptide (TPR) repeat protein